MTANQLKVGDIIITGTNVTVVGSQPVVNGNVVTFLAVLKENRRDVFKLSTRETSVNVNNGNIVADTIISSFNDALNYNASDDVRSKLELAVRKRNWALDNANDDFETDAPDPEPEIPANDVIRYEVTLTVEHEVDPTDDLVESLQYMQDEEQIVSFDYRRIE